MNRLTLALAAAAIVGLATAAVAADKKGPAKPLTGAAHGKQLWAAIGCYQCHGYQGYGGGGPRLAPNPIPFEAFANQLRKPRARMPIYTHKTVSDGDMADMYAYLQTMPKAKAVADIPLLSQ